jgi:hypothetical protein
MHAQGTNLFLVCALAALIPLVIGSLWYSPLLFLKPWLAATGVSPDAGKQGMVKNMILLYVMSFFVAFGLTALVCHQMGFYSMLGGGGGDAAISDPNSTIHKYLVAVYGSYGHGFRTFKHGALHGAIAAFVFALPFFATCAAYEKRSVKYVLITWGFWLVNFTLMGAFICHFAALPTDKMFM